MCITDFDFPHLTPRLIQEFEWREKETGESLTRKQRMLFYSLKQVPGEWEGCDTELQRSLYLIKNMDKMDKNSKAYSDGRYRDLFDSAESVHISAEDVVTYSQSLAHLREYQSVLYFRYEEGKEEGIAIGEERGIAIGEERGMAIGEERGIAIGEERGIAIGEERGRESEKENMARKMLAADIQIDFISQITGIPLGRLREMQSNS